MKFSSPNAGFFSLIVAISIPAFAASSGVMGAPKFANVHQSINRLDERCNRRLFKYKNHLKSSFGALLQYDQSVSGQTRVIEQSVDKVEYLCAQAVGNKHSGILNKQIELQSGQMLLNSSLSNYNKSVAAMAKTDSSDSQATAQKHQSQASKHSGSIVTTLGDIEGLAGKGSTQSKEASGHTKEIEEQLKVMQHAADSLRSAQVKNEAIGLKDGSVKASETTIQEIKGYLTDLNNLAAYAGAGKAEMERMKTVLDTKTDASGGYVDTLKSLFQ